MDTYIVRVYRQAPDNPRAIVGVVETVGEEVKTAFTNLDELWAIIKAERRKLSGSEKGEIGKQRRGD